LGARVKIAVSLEEKLKVVEMLVPLVVCADAVKVTVPPRAREVLPPGVRPTIPGKMGTPAFLLPPQPLMLHRKRIAIATCKAFERLPMHPSLSLVPSLRHEITQDEPSK
jgi:hypothetical protein